MDPDLPQGPHDAGGVNPIRPYIPTLAIGAGAIALIAVASSVLLRSATQSVPIRFSSDITQGSPSAKTIAVDIQGAVIRPGVYQVAPGTRVGSLIDLAGGLADSADIDRIARTVNRAAAVADGAKYYVPHRAEQQGSSQTATSAPSEVAGTSTVSINSASLEVLDTLPGVGEVTAKKIISGRPYATIEELVSKRIIGASLFSKLRERLSP